MNDEIETTKEEVVESEGGDETAVYELGYHILPSVGEEGLPAEVINIKSILEKNDSTFISEEFPILTHLAYTMVVNVSGKKDKYDTAYFGWVKFEATGEHILEIKKHLREGVESNDFDQLGILLHGYAAVQKVLKKAMK